MHLVVLINERYWCAAKRTVTMDRLGSIPGVDRVGRQTAKSCPWRHRIDRLLPDARACQCAGRNGVRALQSKGAAFSIDSDHYVGRFDDRIRFGARLKPQLFRGLLGDDRYDFDSRRQFDHYFGIDRSRCDRFDGSRQNVACAQFHVFLLRRLLVSEDCIP
jgi:hypothetical protein